MAMIPFQPDQILRRMESRMSLSEIKAVASWSVESPENRRILWSLTTCGNEKAEINAIWALTHIGPNGSEWLAEMQPAIVRRLLSENHPSKKRIYLQILKHQEFDLDNPITTELLDFCFSKINSECEPYAVRCFSMYIAAGICKHFPELIVELEQHLEMLSFQELSPGMKSGLRRTRKILKKAAR